jgi:DNA-binding NtrC family response regulator
MEGTKMSDQQESTCNQGKEMVENSVGLAQRIILIIDDDETIRDIIREVLELQSYRIVTVETVQEAEQFLQQQTPDMIGLVITDIHLTSDVQAREGYALYQRWTASYPTLPFLLISGDPSSRTLPEVQSGTVAFLAKPFALQDLLDTVDALFRS